MDVSVQNVYDAALSIMDEASSADYVRRTPAILNTLIGRCYQVSEQYETGPHSMWEPVSGMNDRIIGIDRTLCLSAMPYGLAAMLYLDEDPVRSGSWWSVFLEQVQLCRRSPAGFEPIDDCYGGIETDHGRW